MGQFWTPIFLKGGSVLHAGSQLLPLRILVVPVAECLLVNKEVL